MRERLNNFWIQLVYTFTTIFEDFITEITSESVTGFKNKLLIKLLLIYNVGLPDSEVYYELRKGPS